MSILKGAFHPNSFDKITHLLFLVLVAVSFSAIDVGCTGSCLISSRPWYPRALDYRFLRYAFPIS